MAGGNPSFMFYTQEYLCDREVNKMSMAERGRMFEKILDAVENRDVDFLKPFQSRFIGRIYWRRKPNRPYMPPTIRRIVFERYGKACMRCGSTDRIEIDHVVAYSKGGPSTPENLQPLCKSCNRSKGAR